MLSDFTEFSQALRLWGSAKAINMWAEWRLLSLEGKSKPDPHELLFAMEGIMIQLRRDMGQKRGLKRGNLLRLFINAVDEKLL